ncbi:phenylalanine--tRNA ligase subunit beta [bacterium DOLZORAL124_38_8]|nr:MAG: phenylalanine--tRNA ligase subunit beta [bacterium DOLZORAL124_38_8]
MKLSLNWLQKFIPLKDSAESIGEKITIHTAELEEIINTDDLFSQIVLAELVQTTPHPTAEKLTIGQFNIGNKTVQIVFGDAHPLTIGAVYPVALDGAILPNNLHIKSGDIRGEKSEGMVCHNGELGMKNTELMTFTPDQIGKKLSEIYSDTLFDIDNKSLTHRPDLMGHTGFVRELQTIYEQDENFVPTFELPTIPTSNTVKVQIDTPNCRRFMAVQCANVDVQNSDRNTQLLLESLGTRAISNIVDITNLSLLGLGQPMHAFDADKIKGDITIRMAKPGETIVALDENEYELTAQDLVIVDEEKILSLAGIMGGLSSAVTKDTKSILFESANFNPTVIRKTSARLGLRSESSMRFEKTLDPENCAQGLAFALQTLSEICPHSSVASQITDVYPHPYETKKVSLCFKTIHQYAGTEIPQEKILNILTRLGFAPETEGETLHVTVPSWRATKDVAIQPDIIEEIIRIFGYHNIGNELPQLPIHPPKTNELRNLEWKTRDFWSQNNFYETMLSSFVGADDEKLLEQDQHIKTINGNSETTRLRLTLVSNLLRDLEPELRTHHEISLFELGRTYQAFENEPNTLTVMLASTSKQNETLFFELQTFGQKFLRFLGLSAEQVSFEPHTDLPVLAHPYQAAQINIESQTVGQIYTLHPKKNHIKQSAIVFFEINLTQLLPLVLAQTTVFKPLSEFPTVQRDLSLVVPKKTLVRTLTQTMKEASEYLQSVTLFDEFEDEVKIGKNLKNLAFHLQFSSQTQTLSGDQVEKETNHISKALETRHQGHIR